MSPLVRVETLSDLERELEALRVRLRIPGMSVAAAGVARFFDGVGPGRLLSQAARARAWQVPVAPNGSSLPYALGWFVQNSRGHRLVWHYGHGLESSSLILKIPERQVTFVILANSDGLSRWRRLGDVPELVLDSEAR